MRKYLCVPFGMVQLGPDNQSGGLMIMPSA